MVLYIQAVSTVFPVAKYLKSAKKLDQQNNYVTFNFRDWGFTCLCKIKIINLKSCISVFPIFETFLKYLCLGTW